jgi:small subunit ribosomal protein S8
MCMHDPISDMITRVRNALSSGKKEVKFSSSRQKEAILKILVEEGYISGYEINSLDGNKKEAVVKLKFYEGKPVISKISRISSPGLRKYRGVADLKQEYPNKLETVIVSTPVGVMTASHATMKNLGGEVLVKVS